MTDERTALRPSHDGLSAEQPLPPAARTLVATAVGAVLFTAVLGVLVAAVGPSGRDGSGIALGLTSTVLGTVLPALALLAAVVIVASSTTRRLLAAGILLGLLVLEFAWPYTAYLASAAQAIAVAGAVASLAGVLSVTAPLAAWLVARDRPAIAWWTLLLPLGTLITRSFGALGPAGPLGEAALTTTAFVAGAVLAAALGRTPAAGSASATGRVWTIALAPVVLELLGCLVAIALTSGVTGDDGALPVLATGATVLSAAGGALTTRSASRALRNGTIKRTSALLAVLAAFLAPPVLVQLTALTFG